MDQKILSYIELEKLFISHGYKLYMVGGTVRDYLLNKPLEDMDVVTDATPEEMKVFLGDANYHFAKFGSVTFKDNKKVKFDITTLREENAYSDSRHPGEVKFVKDLNIDVKRRDFTINALYMSSDLKVIDLVNGQDDLNHNIIRMIGNPKDRIEEDPLRILRALRFAAMLNFDIDDELSYAITEEKELLLKLNPEKIKQEFYKVSTNKERFLALLSIYNINSLLNVID